MKNITENLTVYHGSYVEVKIPDLNKCKIGKDFGKGYNLEPENLKNQLCFKTGKALSKLSFVKSEKV